MRQSCQTNLVSALAYADRGFAVLPVRGKAPLTQHGVKDATRDRKTILSWWERWPDAGIAIACGTVSGGLVVLDVDKVELLWQLEKTHGPLPQTRKVRTGRGVHYYFVSPEPIRTQQIVPKLEIRGEGSYVVAPPSLHPDGTRYEVVEDVDPAPLPDALRELLTLFPASTAATSSEVLDKSPMIIEGERNSRLTSLAGSMRRRGMTPEAIEAALLAENSARCDPPLPENEVRRIATSIGRYEPASFTSDCSSLANEIRRIALDEDKPLFDKRREIARMVETDLQSKGHFFRTGDGRGFFFNNRERRLYDVEQAAFQRLLTSISGLSSIEPFFKFSLDLTQTAALRDSQLVEVHTLSYFDPGSGLLAVSDGGPGVWVREAGGEWNQSRNGDSGLFFLTDDDSAPWVPEFGHRESQRWWLDQFLYAGYDMSVEEQKTLMYVWFIHQFFPPLRRTRVVPCFLGPQGSGKTSAMRLIGRLLVGERFDVTGVRRDKEDAFVAAISNRTVLGIDNADSAIPWLADALATYATGQRYRLRKLYTTNEEATYSPRGILLISSRDPRFNRPDVTERLLPLHFERPEQYRTEGEIFREEEARRGQIMGSILLHLGTTADALRVNPPKALPFRMADFASFGEQIFAARGKSNEFISLLKRLESKQAEFACEFDGLVEAIRILLEAGPVEGASVADLHRKCADIAQKSNLLIARTVQGFGRHLSNMRRALEIELGEAMPGSA